MVAVDDDNNSLVAADSDEDIDWEEVDVPETELPNIEITLQVRPSPSQSKINKKKDTSVAERLIRIDCHKIHTVCLIANAYVRNKWINDELLKARLLSLTPLTIQDAFAIIHKSRVPDANQRGRLFESAIGSLTEWWTHSFFAVEPVGHIRNRTFDQVQKMIAHLPPGDQGILDLELLEEEEDSEVIRTPKSLMKHALMRSGSRDTSAQLFTALCRALDIPARLVVSLQSVPWQAGVGKPKTNGKRKDVKDKGKEKAVEDEGEDVNDDDDLMDIPSTTVDIKGKGKARDDSFMGEGRRLDGKGTVDGKGKGKEKAKPIIKLRKQKPKGNVLGSSSSPAPRQEKTPDPTFTPPVFWTEVFSRADARWFPVDPIRCIINKRKAFDPTPSSSSASGQENRMVYVLAFEEDGYARDVTPRYARDYGAKVAKVQGGSKSRKEWWECVVSIVRRPYRLHRDDLEDEELQSYQLTEGMPTSMAGFKDHSLYVLARHLRQNETIHPLVELGKFRGEPVYSRSSVVSLKAAENWMRSGRKIREGCQPMKWVKQRASTVNRKREIEMALEKGREEKERTGEPSSAVEEEVLQGLYAESQTELYCPEPIVDGKIPKNDFGNIDLYVPSMLPRGGVHIPFKGIAKVARKLGFDYAEAVIGFEFKKRRAFPIIEGIVIAVENEPVVLEAYWEAEQQAEETARNKRKERVIKRWTRLVHGLRIRQRLQEQYADKPQTQERHWLDTQVHGIDAGGEEGDGPQAGGYLTAADDVVQAFHLPKSQHVVAAYSTNSSAYQSNPDKNGGASQIGIENKTKPVVAPINLDTIHGGQEDDIEMEAATVTQSQAGRGVPMTMRELADAASEHSIIGNVKPSANAKDSYPSLLSENSDIRTTIRNKTVPNSETARSVRSISPSSTAPRPRGSARKRSKDQKASTDAKQTLLGKRGRVDHASTTPNSVSTRVLRPRTLKSAAQIQEERDREQAYKRAVAK